MRALRRWRLRSTIPGTAPCCSQASTSACPAPRAQCAGRRHYRTSTGRRSSGRLRRQHALCRPRRSSQRCVQHSLASECWTSVSFWPAQLWRTLAEFGADVIKIDNPSRGEYVSSHNDVNRGKRSLLLDLKSAAGREVFCRLLADADVVVQNYRAGKLARLGLSYEDVRQRKPDIIYASLNAFGHVGPWAERPGHEQFAQATTGMQCRFGGDGPPTLQPNPINDYGTGFMGAYAVALALLHHRRTGEGQHVDTALAYTAMLHQSSFMQVYAGKRWDEPSGQDRLGSMPLHRAYRARDGWFFIGARQEDAPRLAAVDGLAGHHVAAWGGSGAGPGGTLSRGYCGHLGRALDQSGPWCSPPHRRSRSIDAGSPG